MENVVYEKMNVKENKQIVVSYGFVLKMPFFILVLVGMVTLFTTIIPISSLLNRLLIGIYLILIFVLVLMRAKTKTLLFLLLFFALMFVDLIITGSVPRMLNDLFYFPLWCLNLLFFVLYYNDLKIIIAQFYKCFLVFAILWTFSVVASLAFPASFIMYNSVRSFVSFAGQTHRFSETALLTMVCSTIAFIVTHKKRFLLLLIFPIITIFISGARTYLVVAMLLPMLIFMRTSKNRFLKIIVLLGGLFGILYAGYYVTSLRIGTTNYSWQIANYGTLHFVTSGRSDFWVIDLNQFFDTSSLFNIFVGRGFNYVYEVNEIYYNVGIYAHNDYINVLLAHGIIGLLIFVGIFISFVRRVYRYNSIKTIELLIYLAIVLFNAIFNMVYTYTISSLITPIIAIALLDNTFGKVNKNILSL